MGYPFDDIKYGDIDEKVGGIAYLIAIGLLIFLIVAPFILTFC